MDSIFMEFCYKYKESNEEYLEEKGEGTDGILKWVK